MKKLFFIAFAMIISFASCKKSSDDSNIYDPAEEGIVGEWVSSGANVAPLLVMFQVDSIYADFRSNNTYLVESFDPDKVKTTYTGTYAQVKSSVGNIWTIVLNQSTPSAVTSEGIFEISGSSSSGYTMKYEVVQTEPTLGTAPTPSGGFGSSSGGALGETNIQKFVRIAE